MDPEPLPFHEAEHPFWRSRRFAASLVSGATLGLSLFFGFIGAGNAAVATVLLGMPVGAFYFGREALDLAVRERRFGTGLLMLAAAIGATLLGEITDGAILVFLFSITETLEEHAVDRTRHAIRRLMKLVPPTAVLLEGGSQRIVAATSLRIGDRFLVKPGEAVPTDGVVRDGASSLNEAVVTGESLPRSKAVGDLVLAGSVNLEGALVIEATKRFEENTVAMIIRLVERAQEVRGRAATIVDRFGQVYTPFVFVLAAGVGFAMGAASGSAVLGAIRAITLLVAASPCALAISVPVTFIAAIGRGARDGILVKGGIHLETLAHVRTVAFDKTGTLTKGSLEVTEVWASEFASEDVLAFAAALEELSEHPVARAIVSKARSSGVSWRPASEFRSIPGRGVTGLVGGVPAMVGSMELCSPADPHGAEKAKGVTLSMQQRGMTVVTVAKDDRILGVIGLSDTPRPEAAAAVRELRGMGIDVAMLTGDNPGTAAAIAQRLSLREVHAGLLPEDKVRIVAELRRRGPVAMVGDGVNDAPALAAADVGVAMGVAGSDIALETADIALMSDNLLKVPRALRLARATRSVSLQNVAASVAILGILIPLAALGVLGITGAVVAHEGSEILVVLSGIRMLRSRLVVPSGGVRGGGSSLLPPETRK